MGQILINSKVNGVHSVYFDDEDYDKLKSFNWFIANVNGHLYSVRKVGKRIQKMHRFIIGVQDPKTIIDHIDGNGLNNRKSNLRLVNKSQNAMNSKRKNKFGYKGISFDGKYVSRIHVNGKRVTLGWFDTAIEAALAYNKAAKEHFGEFAKLNEI